MPRITEDDIRFTETPIRALSWREPYGSLMLHGKKYETRTWSTKYRGLVLMCASQKHYPLNKVLDISGAAGMRRIIERLDGEKQFTGEAFAVGRLVHVLPAFEVKASFEQLSFCNYYSDLFVHVYEDVQPIQPFEFKGKQGWSILTPEQKALIKFI